MLHVSIQVPTRTTLEIVEYYHYWKLSARYDAFMATYKGYKLVPRYDPVDPYSLDIAIFPRLSDSMYLQTPTSLL